MLGWSLRSKCIGDPECDDWLLVDAVALALTVVTLLLSLAAGRRYRLLLADYGGDGGAGLPHGVRLSPLTHALRHRQADDAVVGADHQLFADTRFVTRSDAASSLPARACRAVLRLGKAAMPADVDQTVGADEPHDAPAARTPPRRVAMSDPMRVVIGRTRAAPRLRRRVRRAAARSAGTAQR
jgi:hypothetical protein